MKAYKCDRCGKLFESSPKVIKQIYSILDIRSYRSLDLCSDCKESFQVWMNFDSSTPDEEEK